MAGGTLSPRQKMINLMYLVLTALLALNVSAEILKAFAQIDNSLQVGNSSTSTKTSDKMAAFKKLTDKDEKAKPNYEKAEQVRKICATLLADIRSVKDKLVAEGGNKNGKADEDDYEIKDGLKRLKSEDNIDISSRIMVAEPGGKKSHFFGQS